MDWSSAIEKIAPYVVKIDTPTGSGTGFLCTYNQDKTVLGIATALHVVSDTDDWQQPMRITSYSTQKTILFKDVNRAIWSDVDKDSALILLFKGAKELQLPNEIINLLPPASKLPIGREVGWVGFPNLEPNTLCFFSGNVSARRGDSYLIDGVAMHGVSGGPVLHLNAVDGLEIVGTVSSYRANRATGESLPGLLYAQDISYFHESIARITSIDEANRKKREIENKPPTETPKDGSDAQT